ncbi:pseudaminic acid cytidylyltransferase [Herbaspirillum robiniae]|uniref:Pseudaminic acid cytidylyltransferase n=1 Tax=Herbaspirillum robiniae TaxID=2014887 RepID=A0ABX2LYI4_9BURK|nr:pseudaminic acid cytidylyltransferase [Herbaspirillum robiniae]NUU03186.1 pseudaminic acid cytidylyltransferase [Herbaspirillum robiniae]
MKIAIIPARGGSKRIPRKNIKAFAGKPMISYAIEAALRTGVFEHVIVSTDDAEIADISAAAGAEVPFMRPAHLSDDITPTVPVIAHAIESCIAAGWMVEQACCIYPGVPLISHEDLAAAQALLEHGDASYVFPVTGFPSPIQRALRRQADGTTRPFHPEYVNTRTQDLEPAYHDAGQFYWGRTKAWLDGLNIHANGSTIVLPEWRVVDIDTPSDWERAEAMFYALNKVSG